MPEVKVVSSPYLIPCNFLLSPLNGYSWSNGFCGVVTSCNKFLPSTIPSGLYEFIGYTTVKWNEMMAASLVGIAPVLILFLFLQKYIVEGLTAGAVKN